MNSMSEKFKEFDKIMREIYVYAGVITWIGRIFETLVMLGITLICSDYGSSNIGDEYLFYAIMVGMYSTFVISMYIKQMRECGNVDISAHKQKKGAVDTPNIYEYLKYVPVRNQDIFQSRVKKIVKIMWKRFVVMVALQLVIGVVCGEFNVKAIVAAGLVPVITMLFAIVYVLPYRIGD